MYDEEDDVSIPCGQQLNHSYTSTIGASSDPSYQLSEPRDELAAPTRTIATQTVSQIDWVSVSNWIRPCNVSIIELIMRDRVFSWTSTSKRVTQ
jgi:hypothetical protein